MSHNSFGHLFRVTTWGESHGAAIGCVIDGTPPNIRFTLADLQAELDRRRPGQSRYTTQRQEADAVRVLSGVMPGEAEGEYVSTGTPIALHIDNTDQRSKDYSDIAKRYRPGHADVTYDVKYGIRDYRGGGRSSARETAMRVAAGAIARKVVPGLTVRGALVAIGDVWIDRARWDWAEVSNNPFFCPDAETATRWAELLDGVRKRGSSIGAVVEIVADGVPAGLGAPIYGKLDADIAAGLMSINAVKGVEIGDGFAAAALSGEDNADEMRPGRDGRPDYLSNHAGGILGGISTGQQVIARFAVKPTSSILTPRQSVDADGHAVDVMTKGRHDPCVGIRAVPVGEAMVACAIADHYLRDRGQVGVARETSRGPSPETSNDGGTPRHD
ncbi:chorismate synthase [Aurantimonas sp. 22II-16-19i]|uniref:chorismate synthase n=1 Tax=Aurantimonas sp. 22II-16-19i TaxID=1317114 RepID=UPI0009F7FA43|nr:chorismate synthase [Aurantimonas sp. 22II-16-19i]ORE90270.1 chorismate synthase [Aurantimonas sp. 22II-16-19i]